MSLPTLTPKEWLALARRLTGYAYQMMKKRVNVSSIADAQDVAQTVIAHLYDDHYEPWDPARDPDVFDFLTKQVMSEISNRGRLASNRNRHLEDEQWRRIGSGARTPEDELADKDQASRIMAAVEADAEAHDDAEVALLARCYRDGIDKAADQAEHTRLPIEDIRNARRRFFDAVARARVALDGPTEADDDE